MDDTTIDEKNPKDIVKALKQIAESKGFYDMEINGQNIGLSNKRGINEWVFSKSATSLYKNNPQAFDDKMQSFQNADELLETAKSFINEEAVHKKKFDNFARGISDSRSEKTLMLQIFLSESSKIKMPNYMILLISLQQK